MSGFTTRRDSSANNIPVIGYQDSADAQDIILWAAVQVTETGNTDAQGIFHATNLPIIDATHDWFVDGQNVGRQRLIDGKDITAHDSNNNPLYAGQADGRAGTIPLYTDAGLTTSAVNKSNVTVTYWTLKPVAVDSQGRLTVSAQLSGSLPAGSNNIGKVDVNSLPSLPAGNNNIGNVGIVGALPAGTNTIGQVIPFNPLDNGGEQASIRIRDSFGGNMLAALGYSSDNRNVPTYPLSVSSLPWLYNGDGTVSRVRNAKIFKYVNATSQGITTVWTPNTGKTASILGFFLIASAAVTVQFTAAGSPVGPPLPMQPGIPVKVNLPNIWQPGTAGQAIGVQLSAAATVGGMLWGTEE